MLTSVNHLHECQRMSSSRYQILLLQIWMHPETPSLRDDICTQAAPSDSCNHTLNICICGEQSYEELVCVVRYGYAYFG